MNEKHLALPMLVTISIRKTWARLIFPATWVLTEDLDLSHSTLALSGKASSLRK